MKYVVFVLMIVLHSNAKAGMCDTAKVYFGNAEYILSISEKQKLDKFLDDGILKKGEKVSITGYADHVGEENKNLHLSQKRADAVAAYFVAKGWKRSNIELIRGKGEIMDSSADGVPTNRRVDIIQYGIYGAYQFPKNVFFIPGTDTIAPGDIKKLDTLIAILKENPCLKISIEGHTCCKKHGISDLALVSDTGFCPLCYERHIKMHIRPIPFCRPCHVEHAGKVSADADSGYIATAISRGDVIWLYMLNNGISRTRMLNNPQGSAGPLIENPTNDKEHAMNCRVEIRIVKKKLNL